MGNPIFSGLVAALNLELAVALSSIAGLIGVVIVNSHAGINQE